MPSFQHFSATINYRDDGAGAPIVALHASASTGYQWDSLTGYLTGRCRVIRPDLPGYGLSDRIASGVRLSDTVDCLSSLFRILGEPVHLVGHSFGGAVALKAAQMMQDKIASLTLIEPAAFHLLVNDAEGRRYLNEIVSVRQDMEMQIEAGDAETAMARFIDFWNGEGAWARTSGGLRRKLMATVEQVISDFNAIESEQGSFEDLTALSCPVLTIAGGLSPNLTRYLTQRLSECIAGARQEEIVDAGHMVPLTDPHEVDPLIASHILNADRSDRNVFGLAAVAA
jgi:lipase